MSQNTMRIYLHLLGIVSFIDDLNVLLGVSMDNCVRDENFGIMCNLLCSSIIYK
jgi:hypothetical protein